MAETILEAALNGASGSGRAYFFLGDQYVIYDWGADRVVSGTHPITDWGLPVSFAPLGFATRFDTTMNGKTPKYRDKAYFFKDQYYMRYDWNLKGSDFAAPKPLTAWNLPDPFVRGVQAAFNGKFSREGKGYFFRDRDYVRYDWNADRADPGYPKPIGTLVGMPASFAGGVDAALDGDGRWGDYGYLFQEDQYLRFNWDRHGANPRVDQGYPLPIRGNWPGLSEFLLAGKAKAKAFEWLWAALPQLQAYAVCLKGGLAYPNASLLETALATHFHIAASWSAAQKRPWVDQIIAGFQGIQNILNNSANYLQFRTPAEAAADGCSGIHAYVMSGKLYLTELYPTHGTLCRAAELMHESVHIFDSQSGARDIHIPEWYVTQPVAQALGLTYQDDPEMARNFATRYDLMTVDKAVHNPSSYVAFAQLLCYGRDTRFGAGKPNE